MVGYDPHEKIHLSSVAHAVAGAVSGAASRALTQPLDVIKIRFQVGTLATINYGLNEL